MKYLDEFRNAPQAQLLAERIARLATRPCAIMEVCGGQTHSLIRHGIDQVLPPQVEMIHGPGCPVCVTPTSVIDQALAIAALPDVILCSFGDMLRVPGSSTDLFGVRSSGGDVRIVYSPLDALKLARQNPAREVVFLAIGFETTAPANAIAVKLAREQQINNFSALVSHALVPPAIEAIMNSPGNRVEGFLAAGHVCSVMGYHQYHALSARYQAPIVVTGFEPLDLLEGIHRVIQQFENGEAFVENAYERAVTEHGNAAAQEIIEEVFTVTDRVWRGIGIIPSSGWRLRDEYAQYDAEKKFHIQQIPIREPTQCRAGEVLLGKIKPNQCEAFGTSCTPLNPLGATMVSSEGACAAYFNFGRFVQIGDVVRR